MQVLTNKINTLKFEEDIIDRDFDIYRVDLNNNEQKRKIYPGEVANDFAKISLIQSVCYTWGDSFYLLYCKNQYNEDETNKLKSKINFEVKKLDIKEVYRNVIISLFLNMLYKTDNYSNTEGSLFYCYKVKNYYLYALQFKIDSKCHMQITHRTFKKYYFNYKTKLTKYYYDRDKNQLWKYSNNHHPDNKTSIYIMEGKKDEKNNVTYFDYSKFQSFKDSKMGCLNNIVNSFNENYKDYIIINFQSSDFNTTSIKYNQKKIDIKEKFYNIKINIVDTINNSESITMCKKIKNYLTVNNITVTENDNSGSFNIRIIYPQEYYEGKDDPHNDKLSGITQHVCINTLNSLDENSFDKFNNHQINRIFLELLVKQDIKNNQISIVDYSKYTNDTYVFVIVKKVSKNNGVKMCVSHELTVYPNGKMEYHEIPFDESKYNNHFITKKQKIDYSIDGLIVNLSKNVIHTIKDSGEKVIPDLNKVTKILESYNPEGRVLKKNMIKYLKDYASTYHKEDECKDFLLQIENASEKLQIKDIKLPKKLQNFVQYFYNNTGVLLKNIIRNNKQFPDILTSFMKFHYRLNNNNEISYYNGTESPLNLAISKAYIVRTITNITEKEFLDLCQFMYADFVRFGYTTVLPFQFKYLRDFILENSKK